MHIIILGCGEVIIGAQEPSRQICSVFFSKWAKPNFIFY